MTTAAQAIIGRRRRRHRPAVAGTMAASEAGAQNRSGKGDVCEKPVTQTMTSRRSATALSVSTGCRSCQRRRRDAVGGMLIIPLLDRG